MMANKAFVYEANVDGYRCLQGQLLDYATTDRTSYRHYKSDPAICRACPLLASCTSSRNAARLITRHVWAEARERVDGHRLAPWGKRIYKRRKETVERSLRRRRSASAPVPARRRPEHQENRSRPGSSARAGLRNRSII
jgi:DDE family transposase